MIDQQQAEPGEALGSMPIVRVSGSPRDIGEQYGSLARTRILRCREHYAAVYRKFAGWGWKRARVEAEAFVDVIEEFAPESLEQIRGIAAGSGLDTLDILAINLRTEILFAGQARSLAAPKKRTGECSIFTFTRESDERRLSAQNWDWIPFSADTVVLLEVEQAGGLNYSTVVEAGILAKFGLNSAGLALTTNALVSRADRGEPGIPYHVMLHSLMTSTSLDEARHRLEFGTRASSASYLVLDRFGKAFGAETRPGDASRIAWSDVSRDEFGSCEITHTNHFMHDTPGADSDDLAPSLMPDSAHRLARIQGPVIGAGKNGRMSEAEVKTLLADHDGYPNSVCCHPNPDEDPLDQGLTVASAIIDPGALTMEVGVGTPCTGQWHQLGYLGRWNESSPKVVA